MTEEEKAAAAAAEAAAAEQARQDATAAEAAAREAAEAEAARQSQKTAEEIAAEVAQLRRERDEAIAAAKKFEGIDPDKARENAKKVTDAEKAALDAEKAKATAEGNFEKLREIQSQETAAAIDAARTEAADAKKEAEEARAALATARVETAFANSRYLQDETILTGPKARRLYSDHVEIEDGKVVVYDAPRGEAKRAKIMNGKGVALPFDEAIKKVVESDADKDLLLRTKTKSGAGSSTTDATRRQQQGQSRHSKLVSGLKALREK